MKSLGKTLLGKDPFEEIVIGNTALVRAMIESNVRVATTYPGSPTPEIASAILSIPAEERPFYFEYSTNEKVATEVAFGASINGHLSCVFFKSVGLNVAADSFVQLGLMELPGGMVIALGDDPGANSSQNEQDNRHYTRLSCIPAFEPADPQEAYEMFIEGASVSVLRKMPVIIRMTTHVCHAKQKVSFGGWEPVPLDRTPRFDPQRGPYVPIAGDALALKRKSLARLEEMRTYSETSPFNRVCDNGNRDRGVITAGLPFLSLLDVLEEAHEKPDILKLGLIHPVPSSLIRHFLETHREVKVLEELDDVLEKEIKAMAYDSRQSTLIHGKRELEDWVGEYTPDKVAQVLNNTWPGLVEGRQSRGKPPLAPRPPQMCPGCGHRSAFHAIRQALRSEDVTVADIGCHTLGYLPPYRMGQVLLSMGHSTGTGSGLSLFNHDRKVVAFIGDSTLFHAGMPGIVNAVFNRHDLTLVVMENGTTAMTGHQDHPGSGANASGPVEALPIEALLEGLGVKSIRRVDTYSQSKLLEALREALDEEGFSVVIATHPCMLKFTREQRRKKGYSPGKVSIDQNKCIRVMECISEFACPSFQRESDGSIYVHPELCIGDASCIQTCPTHAILPDRGKQVAGESEGS